MTEGEILPKLNYNLALTKVTEWVQNMSWHPTPLAGGAEEGGEDKTQTMINYKGEEGRCGSANTKHESVDNDTKTPGEKGMC